MDFGMMHTISTFRYLVIESAKNSSNHITICFIYVHSFTVPKTVQQSIEKVRKKREGHKSYSKILSIHTSRKLVSVAKELQANPR